MAVTSPEVVHRNASPRRSDRAASSTSGFFRVTWGAPRFEITLDARQLLIAGPTTVVRHELDSGERRSCRVDRIVAFHVQPDGTALVLAEHVLLELRDDLPRAPDALAAFLARAVDPAP